MAALAEAGALALLLALGGILFVRLFSYILPFVIGLLLAVALAPVVRPLRRAGVPRRAAIIAVLILVPGAALALFGWFSVQAAREAIGFSQALPGYFAFWRQWSERTLNEAIAVYGHLPPRLVDAFQATAADTALQAKQFAISAVSALFAGVAALPDATFVVVLSVVSAYFYLADWTHFEEWLLRALPPGWAPKLKIVAADVGSAVAGLLRTQLILIAVTTLVGVIGLAVMRVNYAFLLGAAIGVTGWVPIVGSGIVTLPWAIGALATGNVPLAIKVLLLQAVASLIRHLIEPQVMAKNVGLGTFPTLFGMYVGLKCFGFIGLVVGPVALIGIRSLVRARIFGDLWPSARAQEADGENAGAAVRAAGEKRRI